MIEETSNVTGQNLIFEDSIRNKKSNRYFIFKRAAVFLLDGLMSLIIYIGLLLSLGNLTTREICKDSVNKMNQEFIKVSEVYNVPVKKEWQFGLIEIDRSKFIKIQVEEEKLDIEKAVEKYNEVNKDINEVLDKNKTYVDESNKFYVVYKIVEVVCMFVPLFVFQFIVPLYTKKKQTLFMMAFHLVMVKRKTNTYVSKYQVMLRFFIIFTTEYLMLYLLFDLFGLLIAIFVSIVIILITPNKLALHDAAMMIKLVNENEAYTEDIVEEEQNSLASH